MLYRSARAQGDYFGGFASREPLFDFRHVLLFEIPYIREKLSVYLLGATLRHIGARFSAITEHAAHRTEKAGEAREIEENHRIAFCKAHRQSAGIVSVYYPPRLFQFLREPRIEILSVGLYPARMPPELIEMDERKSRFYRKLKGKRRFAGTGRADDKNLFYSAPPAFLPI